MTTENELAAVRQVYAKAVLATAHLNDAHLEQAFANVKREDFLGDGPWQLFQPGLGYVKTSDSDPRHVYVNQTVGLMPERMINNGQPSLHAILLACVHIHAGDHVVHIGAGTGYYTAIMAQLVGNSGRVTAIEYDAELAIRARACLAHCSNVEVSAGDGAQVCFGTANVIYVNAGVTHPANHWLDNLAIGGRLMLPLTTDENFSSAARTTLTQFQTTISGAYFLIQRHENGFDARGVLSTVIIPATTLRDGQAEVALATAFKQGGWQRVKQLVRGDIPGNANCWISGPGWALTM